MLYHTRCVAAARTRALVVADLPFGTLSGQRRGRVRRVGRGTQGRRSMVKLEGGAWLAPTVEFLAARGIPVCGHVGLQPQSVNALGGYRVQGKTPSRGRCCDGARSSPPARRCSSSNACRANSARR